MDQTKTSGLKLNSSRRILHVFWAFLLLVFLLFPFLTNAGNTGFVTCRFHQLTGLSCPTCGMSRSLYDFTHFHLLESFKMHLFGPVMYALALLLFIKLSIELISGKTIEIGIAPKMIKNTFFAIGILWIIYWLVRMGVEVILA